MSLFYPTLCLKRITEITPSLLKSMKIKGLILDIDNTLTTHNNPNALEKLDEWLITMQKSNIFMIIVSNNNENRVKAFADSLELGFVSDAMKPLSRGLKKAVKIMGIKASETAVVGDQIFTDIMGANIFHIKSILVEPIEIEDKIFFKFKRKLEKIVLKSYRKNNRHKGA